MNTDREYSRSNEGLKRTKQKAGAMKKVFESVDAIRTKYGKHTIYLRSFSGEPLRAAPRACGDERRS